MVLRISRCMYLFCASFAVAWCLGVEQVCSSILEDQGSFKGKKEMALV